MEILINYTGKRGGGLNDTYKTVESLIELGHDVVLIISEYSEDIKRWDKLDIKEIVQIKTYKSKLEFIVNSILFKFNYKKILKALNKKYSFDYIYSPMVTPWTGKINSYFKKKIKITVNHDPIVHSGTPLINRIYNKFFGNEIVYKKSDVIVVHSNKFLNIVDKQYPGAKVIYIPLGTHDFGDKIYSNSIYDSDYINFLFFGRINEYKGIDILLMAFSKLVNKHNNVKLTIVGEGNLSQYVKYYPSMNNVNVINKWVKDEEIPTYFSGENIVLVCPYKDATQSGPIMIAMNYEIPVIASNIGGLTEQVQDNITGLLFNVGDIDNLVISMERMLDVKEYSRLASNIKNIKNEFNWKASTKKLLVELSILRDQIKRK